MKRTVSVALNLLISCGIVFGQTDLSKQKEILGIKVPLLKATVQNETAGPALLLPKNQEVLVKTADITPGLYHLAVKLRTGDLTEKSEKTMLGGYGFLFPKSSYAISVNGNPFSVEVSPRMPRVVYQFPNSEECVLAGWVYSKEPVAIKNDGVIRIRCSREGGVIFEIVVLNEGAWEAEKVRSSGLYKDPGGAGWALGWLNLRPREWYLPETLQNVIEALGKFQKGEAKSFGSPPAFDAVISQGKALGKAIGDFKKNETRLARDAVIIKEGQRLAGAWQKYFDQVNKVVGTELVGILGKIDGAIKPIKVNEQCYAGREAVFNQRMTTEYIEGAKKEIAKFGALEDIYKKSVIKALTYTQDAAEFAIKAKEWAVKPQLETVLAGYEIKALPISAGTSEKPGPQSQLCLNGPWNYSVEGGPEKPPVKWDETIVPTGAWLWAVNKLHASDDDWGKRIRMYWWWEDAVWYKTQIHVPQEWAGQKIALEFNDVIMYCEVFVNGRYGGNHYGGFVGFELDVTDKIVPGRTNSLLVYVQNANKTRRPGKHPLTGDPNLFPTNYEAGSSEGGIRGDVFLRCYPTVYVKDVFVRTLINERKLILSSTLVNTTTGKEKIKLSNSVRQDGKNVFAVGDAEIELPARSEKTIVQEKLWPDVKLWGIGGSYGHPENRYYLATQIRKDQLIDQRFTQFGFRQLQIKGLHFTLNGKQIWLQGSQIHSVRRDLALHNLWLADQLIRIFRQANVVFLRTFQGSTAPFWYQAASRIGMIMEGESPGWRFHPPLDILGRPDYLDPIWLENFRQHYYGVTQLYRNQPSFMIYSAENESLNDEEAVDAGVLFTRWIKEKAPETIVDCHSCATAWDDRYEVANIHDYGIGVDRLREWVKLKGNKPINIGEFWNYAGQAGAKSGDPVQARGADNMMGKWLTRQLREYQSVPCAGIMPFEFVDMGSTYSNSDPKVMGPWADLIRKGKPIVQIPWPSFSGTGGYRFDKMLSGAWTLNVNFFDSTRPVFTPTEAYKGLKGGYRDYPGWSTKRPPELIVTVLENGKTVPGINVFLIPLDGQSVSPLGVKADEGGKAWFILDEPGKYAVQIEKEKDIIRINIPLKSTTFNQRAGFDYIPRFTVDLANPEIYSFAEGVKPLTPASVPTAIPEKSQNTPTPSPAQPQSPRIAVSPDGFIRSWLVLGPFPNSGGRKKPEMTGWDVDPLKTNGGEKLIQPDGSMQYTIDFKKDEFGYWDPGAVKTSWQPVTASEDFVDLGKIFVRREIPGLDFSPVQYVIGYAACYLENEKDQDCLVALGSDDGAKVWMNHEFLGQSVLFRNAVKDDNKFKGHLKKGTNIILIKVNQDIGDYLFCVRLLDSAGKPIIPKIVNPSNVGAGQTAAVTFGHDFIRRWLVCGPFPNPGGRPKCGGWDTDFLQPNGGERAIEPVAGMSYQPKFIADPTAGRVAAQPTVSWKVVESETDAVNLGQIFVMPGLEGLDFAPVQYVSGYAECEIQSDRPRTCRLEIHTLNAAKVWLNHELIFDKHLHRTVKDTGSVLLQQFKGEPFVLDVKIKKGANPLLLKLDVDYGDFGFQARFLATEVNPKVK